MAKQETSEYPAWWDWDDDKDGDTIEGRFVRAGRGFTANGDRPFVVLDVEGTERTVWLHHGVLQNIFAREVHRGLGLWLGLWDLPRRSDVSALVTQVANLERQVRQMSRELERRELKRRELEPRSDRQSLARCVEGERADHLRVEALFDLDPRRRCGTRRERRDLGHIHRRQGMEAEV